MTEARYVYTDRDGVRVQDPAIRAYGSPYLNQVCVRAGAWHRGKALVRFVDSGELAIARHTRDECRDAGVAWHFKQHGGLNHNSGGCLLDGEETKEFPRTAVA